MTKITAPEWARHLTDDDEWVVRTALANVASDLDRVADVASTTGTTGDAIRESAQRYRETLARIDLTDDDVNP
jgi:hypothetical protein